MTRKPDDIVEWLTNPDDELMDIIAEYLLEEFSDPFEALDLLPPPPTVH